ncbi:hypothetical protein J4456_02900 [Candidatus Pacearchaeota archaeon]|nr:hypothetical protein [Candidatus Pacearchaeota archaeon]
MPSKISNLEKEKNIKAFIASFFTIIGFIIAIIIWKEDKYSMYYAKHGLILFIGQLLITLIGNIFVPMMHWFTILLWIFWAILWVMTWMNALSGNIKYTFIITDLAEKINV